MNDIRVSALVLLHPQRRELLMVRKAGTSSFMLPGGKPEEGETAEDTIVREIAEELDSIWTVTDCTLWARLLPRRRTKPITVSSATCSAMTVCRQHSMWRTSRIWPRSPKPDGFQSTRCPRTPVSANSRH